MPTLEVNSAERDDCPYCGSTKIEAGEANFDNGGRRCECQDCGRYWDEGFVVTTVFIPDEWRDLYLERKYALDHCTCRTKPDEFCPVHSEELNH